MTYENLNLERNGPIFQLALNRPGALNALSPRLIEELLGATEAVARSDARVLVVSGSERAFSAGVDLKATSSPEYTREAAEKFSDNARKIATMWEIMAQVVIAKVSGYCFTGGLELALGADFIVASEGAEFADTHARIGFRPGWGLSQRLPKRVGVQLAKEMSFTARRVRADEAKAMGLILDAVPADQLDARVQQLADACILNAGGSIAAYKDLYRNSLNMLFDDGLNFEATAEYDIPERKAMQAAMVSKLST